MPVVIELSELEQIRSCLIPVEHDDVNSDVKPDIIYSSPRLTTKEQNCDKPQKVPIPCIVHQIYWDLKTKKSELPSKWRSSKESWIENHPTMIYVPWDSEMVKELIARHYSFFIDRYSRYSEAQKINLARAFILHRYGGIYCDIWIKVKHNLWHLFDGQEQVYLTYHNDNGEIRYSNKLVASPPNSPFWSILWSQLIMEDQVSDDPGPNLDYPHSIMWNKYADFFDQVVKKYDGTVGLLPKHYFKEDEAFLYFEELHETYVQKVPEQASQWQLIVAILIIIFCIVCCAIYRSK